MVTLPVKVPDTVSPSVTGELSDLNSSITMSALKSFAFRTEGPQILKNVAKTKHLAELWLYPSFPKGVST